MVALASADISFFEDFCFDRRGGALSRRDERGVYLPIAIGSRALEVLGVLVERRRGSSAARAMATMTATRHLAAILAADVAGYSRLMGADEEGTRERLKGHLVSC